MKKRLDIRKADLGRVFVIAKPAVTTYLQGEKVILDNEESGALCELNVIGGLIWGYCTGRHSVKGIIVQISNFLPEREAAKSRVLVFLRELYWQGFVEVRLEDEIVSVPLWQREPVREAHLFVTHQCPLHCCHCCIVREERAELTTEEIFSAINELSTLGCLTLSLTGGEVFFRKDFLTIARYARQKGLSIKIATSGVLLSSALLDELTEMDPVDVSISVYSANPEIHDQITGVNGSWEKSVKAIEELVRRGITVFLKCMVMKQNFDGYEQVARLAQDLGVQFQFDPCITSQMNGCRDPIRLRLNEEQLSEFVCSPHCKRPERRLISPGDRPCNAGTGRCAINAYGDVFPCVLFPFKVGNIREKRLREIWDDSPQLREVRQLTINDMGQCSKCSYLEICAPCPGLGLLEHGNFRVSPAWSCLMTKLQYQFITKKERR